MDKSWISKNRASPEYLKGIKDFLQFASMNGSDSDGNITCPCVKCQNSFWCDPLEVEDHLLCYGFTEIYTYWDCHGETLQTLTPPFVENVQTLTPPFLEPNVDYGVHTFVRETLGIQNPGIIDDRHEFTFEDTVRESTEPNTGSKKPYEPMEDAYKELYPGCQTFSKLSFVLHLYHVKTMGGMSNKCLSMMLDLLKIAFPKGVNLPRNAYETNQIVKKLGVRFEKIHACRNHCMLFWKENADKDACSVCGASRWLQNEVEIPSQGPQHCQMLALH